MNKLVSTLRRQNRSGIDSAELKSQLNNMFEYVANAEELNWDDVMDVSADIARNILDESSSTEKSLRETDDHHAALWDDLKEVTVTPKMLKSLEAAFGKRMFGKIGGIKVNVDENARWELRASIKSSFIVKNRLPDCKTFRQTVFAFIHPQGRRAVYILHGRCFSPA